MEKQLNTFQVRVLHALIESPAPYQDMLAEKRDWLRSNLEDSEETIDSWEEQLIEEGYARRELINGNTANPLVWMPTQTSKIKIEQKGRKYLASIMATENDIAINEEIPVNASKKLSLVECAIKHVYLGMFDSKQQVTKTNNAKIAFEDCGLGNPSSGLHLYQKYEKYVKVENRQAINTDNKRAAKVHLKRYETILPLLEKQSHRAFEAAKKDLLILQGLFDKWYTM